MREEACHDGLAQLAKVVCDATHRPVGGDQHGSDRLLDPASEYVDAGSLRLFDTSVYDSAETIGSSSSLTTMASPGKEMRYLVMPRMCPAGGPESNGCE
jgi:hypothetical protein